MVRHDERERRRRRLGVLSERVGASRAAVLPPGKPNAVEHPDRVHLRSAVREGRERRTESTDSITRTTSRWHLEHLPDDEAAGEQVRAGAGSGTAPRTSTASTIAPPDSALSSIGEGVREGTPKPVPAQPVRRQRRTVGSDVRAPSAVAETDDETDVRTPDWLRDRHDRDDDLGGDDDFEGDDAVPVGRFGGARLDPGRRGALTLAVVGLIALFLTAYVVMRERPVSYPVPPLASVQTTTIGPGVPTSEARPPDAGLSPPVSAGAPVELVVSVVGLVHNSGLVRLPEGARVADAVAAAGGAREGADLTGLNLAQRVRDGDQILVGAAPHEGGPPQAGSVTVSGSGAAPGADTTPEIGPTGKVDLNSATEAQLDALPGIGPVTARAILAWRTANGRFGSIDQLAEVDGIGPTRLARLRDLVTV
ncbi:ComEA family DNA-binding protein [Nocardia higoensis]|uniref:ComEA family DNA-binding protein n=1 Tax=Nocardia higoensis TaxID=228599 RepID=UPI0009FC8596|nr:ComEA family DNA-binding protein [Nocardia higoensis]